MGGAHNLVPGESIFTTTESSRKLSDNAPGRFLVHKTGSSHFTLNLLPHLAGRPGLFSFCLGFNVPFCLFLVCTASAFGLATMTTMCVCV